MRIAARTTPWRQSYWTLATGSASELSLLMNRLSRKELLSQTVSEQVNAWLATGVDLSMVASAFGLDPLSHVTLERELFVRNKTGTDLQVRADVGTVGRGDAWLSYAVLGNWSTTAPERSDTALAGMNAIGAALREELERTAPP